MFGPVRARVNAAGHVFSYVRPPCLACHRSEGRGPGAAVVPEVGMMQAKHKNPLKTAVHLTKSQHVASTTAQAHVYEEASWTGGVSHSTLHLLLRTVAQISSPREGHYELQAGASLALWGCARSPR